MIKKPKFKICKRLGPGVYDKCQTSKFSTSPTRFVRGKRRRQVSEYGAQLMEKQKIRFSYGISERQLRNYVKKANMKKGDSSIADNLYEGLESRLDNVAYRMGLATSRRAARQLVSHGHLMVNGKKTTVPSYEVKKGDKIEIRESSKAKRVFSDLETRLKDFIAPGWLSFSLKTHEGKVLSAPKNDETFLDLNSVLEFYSR